jgi:hypothetical protein
MGVGISAVVIAKFIVRFAGPIFRHSCESAPVFVQDSNHPWVPAPRFLADKLQRERPPVFARRKAGMTGETWLPSAFRTALFVAKQTLFLANATGE